MRDYSKPFYDVNELAAAFNGVCKCLGKDEFCCGSSLPMLGTRLSSLAKAQGLEISPAGDLGIIGVSLQQLIMFLIKNKVKSKEQLQVSIDAEVKKLPPNPLINYFVV